jgi:hypothetical protein
MRWDQYLPHMLRSADSSNVMRQILDEGAGDSGMGPGIEREA